ncbi:phage baseplate protein [Acinetobacter beijerinckii]|uniref:phage baseplate protein n=1 Tax=Acinetobacter beijerinckii TaxID=262668 RepID=UPI00300806EB
MAIQFYLTSAGRNAALNAASLGLNVSLTHIAVGSGKYDPSNAMTLTNSTLVSEIERYPLNGGSVEPVSHTLRFVANIEPTQTADAYEIGLITDQGVLFAIAATTSNTPLIRLVANIVSIVTFGMLLQNIGVSNINISIDPNTPIAIALMNQHLNHANPHPQYALLTALQNALDRIEILENKVIEDIKIGDVFVTANNFENGDEVAAHKRYGKWIRFSEGLTLVGLSTKINDPSWTKSIGNNFGTYEHKLTINELPSHNHSVIGGGGEEGSNNYIDTTSQTNTNTKNTENTGGDHSHNNVQPSKVVGMWLRIAENLTITASSNSVLEGNGLTFTLETIDIPQGSLVPWIISGIQSEDITPNVLSGNFTVGSDGKAVYSIEIVDDFASEGSEILRFSLANNPYIYCDVVIQDTSVTTEVVISNSYAGTVNQSNGYFIKQSINLYDAFITLIGRTPEPNEKILFIVESDVAIVANDLSTFAIIGDDRWLNNEINLRNFGLIAGKGGNPAWNDQNYSSNPPVGPVYDATDGGTAIQSDYELPLVVQNYGLIAAGGGGGGAAGDGDDNAVIAGGGGAPFGVFHPNKSFQTHTNPTVATLLDFGIGGKVNIFNDNWWLWLRSSRGWIS